MHYTLLQFLILLSEAVLLIILAQKVKISCSIFLVLAGLGIGYIPGISTLSINPEVIFQIFLSALLYEACYTLSNDFRRWQRPISLLRFRTGDHHLIGCRCLSSSTIPGLHWAWACCWAGLAIAHVLYLIHGF